MHAAKRPLPKTSRAPKSLQSVTSSVLGEPAIARAWSSFCFAIFLPRSLFNGMLQSAESTVGTNACACCIVLHESHTDKMVASSGSS